MNLTPQEASDRMLTLSEEQSRLSDEATELEIAEQLYLHAHRENHKSDKATLSAWKVTEQGQRQIRVIGRLKVLKSELSVLKNFLRHEENKARNISQGNEWSCGTRVVLIGGDPRKWTGH